MLISITLIKWGINFLDFNFHYFGYTDILDTFERGVFHQRGDLPTTVKLQRTLQCDQISLLELFREMNKVSMISDYMFNFVSVVSPEVLFLC